AEREIIALHPGKAPRERRAIEELDVDAQASLRPVVRFEHFLVPGPDDEQIPALLPLHVGLSEALEELDAELRHADVLGQGEETPAAAGRQRCRRLGVRRVGLDDRDARGAAKLQEVGGGTADHAAADDRYVVITQSPRPCAGPARPSPRGARRRRWGPTSPG